MRELPNHCGRRERGPGHMTREVLPRIQIDTNTMVVHAQPAGEIRQAPLGVISSGLLEVAMEISHAGAETQVLRSLPGVVTLVSGGVGFQPRCGREAPLPPEWGQYSFA